MTVYALVLIVCVSHTSWPDEGMAASWSCDYKNMGLFQTEAGCHAAGDPKLGTRWFSDIADNASVHEVKCVPNPVRP